MPNPKLQYDAQVPSFLRRLKGEIGGAGERSPIQHARPKKELIDRDDEEPTYVDESNENVTREEFERMAAGSEVKDENDIDKDTISAEIEPGSDEKDIAARTSKATSNDQAVIGAATKRKLARVIGNEDDGRVDETGEPVQDLAGTETEEAKPKKAKKAAKKGKKIKLSFDEDSET